MRPRISKALTFAGLTLVVPGAKAYSSYTIQKAYNASNFFDAFDFVEGHDTYTNGFAYYTNKNTAMNAGYAKIQDNKVSLGVDSTSSLNPGDPQGRKSVRLESQTTFDNGLIIGDFAHLPGSACGMWPAFWTLHDDHEYSEIDIIEGVSLSTANELTMYTSRSNPCVLEQLQPTASSHDVHTDCYQTEEQMDHEPKGCGVTSSEGSFGTSFNDNGGGIWALQLESDRIKAWYIPRAKIGSDITDGKPDPDTWGTPVMNFGPGTCDVAKAWKEMKIVLNISFCGDNAGNNEAWNGWGDDSISCKLKTRHDTCNEYVAKNPQSFTDTYFLINSVKVYQRQ